MAKRFTDTGKWDKQWFMDLSPKGKLLWIFLCDSCDHAGIWEENYKLASCQIGLEISNSDLNEIAKNVIPLEGRKIFIPGFIEFQYGRLDSANRAHLSAIRILEKYGIDPKTLAPIKGLISPIQGYKDKDKDKDKDKEGDVKGEIELSGNSGMLPAVVAMSSQQTSPVGNFTRDEITLCEKSLLDTLEAFGIERPILPHDHQVISTLMRKYGAKSTAYALYGMQFEQGTDSFDPKKHVAVSRLLDGEKFEKALNRGAAEKAKLRKAAEAEKRKQEREIQRTAEAS